jgi:hypothetical protein
MGIWSMPLCRLLLRIHYLLLLVTMESVKVAFVAYDTLIDGKLRILLIGPKIMLL